MIVFVFWVFGRAFQWIADFQRMRSVGQGRNAFARQFALALPSIPVTGVSDVVDRGSDR